MKGAKLFTFPVDMKWARLFTFPVDIKGDSTILAPTKMFNLPLTFVYVGNAIP